MIGKAKRSVLSQLKDADSAQFRNVEACPENKDMVVGEVNSKNSFGALTGFTYFFSVKGFAYLPETLEPIERNGETYSFNNQLMLACFEGADPDLSNFVNAVESNTATSVEDTQNARASER